MFSWNLLELHQNGLESAGSCWDMLGVIVQSWNLLQFWSASKISPDRRANRIFKCWGSVGICWKSVAAFRRFLQLRRASHPVAGRLIASKASKPFYRKQHRLIQESTHRKPRKQIKQASKAGNSCKSNRHINAKHTLFGQQGQPAHI